MGLCMRFKSLGVDSWFYGARVPLLYWGFSCWILEIQIKQYSLLPNITSLLCHIFIVWAPKKINPVNSTHNQGCGWLSYEGEGIMGWYAIFYKNPIMIYYTLHLLAYTVVINKNLSQMNIGSLECSNYNSPDRPMDVQILASLLLNVQCLPTFVNQFVWWNADSGMFLVYIPDVCLPDTDNKPLCVCVCDLRAIQFLSHIVGSVAVLLWRYPLNVPQGSAVKLSIECMLCMYYCFTTRPLITNEMRPGQKKRLKKFIKWSSKA